MSLHSEHLSRSLSDYGSRSQISQSYVDGARFEPDDLLQKHEHLSRPMIFEGVVNNRGDPRKLRQHQDDDRHDTRGRSVAGDTDAFIVIPVGHGEHDRDGTDYLYSSRYTRRVSAPASGRILSGQRTNMASSMRRRQSHELVKHSETSDISEASPTSGSDMPQYIRHSAVVCNSVPKSVSHLAGTDVPTGRSAVYADDVSSVFRNFFHSSLSSDQSDTCELSESPLGNEIHTAFMESGMHLAGSQTSEDGTTLITSAARNRHSHEPQDDTVSIYDFIASEGEAVAAEDDSSDDDLDPGYGFHHLQHRLTLFLMMALFGTDEEFLCKIQCPIVQYIIEQPYQGMLVMSSHRFYVLKFTSEDHRQPPDQWIQCVEIQPIPELRYIDMGLGGQSLRLEFVTDCSSFTLIIGNRDKTVQFVEALHGHLTSYAIRHGINSTVVVNEDTDQSTLDNLDRDVVSQVTPGQKLLYYCMGSLEKGVGERIPVSVVVSSSEICLVLANHQWPQPRLQGPVTVETVGKQFTVLARQRINNVASLKVCPISMKKVSLELFAGADDHSSCWNLTLASRQNTADFIDAISGPWSQEFGVGLEVTHLQLDF
ncbi:unnamed protein product [Candidula unifasciata]|uniref:Uncharacterized protein n=1 Tax=Candidula unifasciata TaxID=100452 RepID=A0A8S3ZKM9_9EUPU|nr:unnamed protein product [Candidula unifasciata]